MSARKRVTICAVYATIVLVKLALKAAGAL